MFVEEYLRELRQDRFAPAALWVYVRRIAARVREQMDANPGVVRSVWSVALGFFAVAFAASVGMALVYDRHLAYDFFLQTALWILPAFGAVKPHAPSFSPRASGLRNLSRCASVPAV